jgi:very-short-patch-repair endonuclease
VSSLPDQNRPSLDAVAAAIATRQHGLVTRRQLRDAGVAFHVIDRRVGSGRLRPVHRGVYQVGPILSKRAREMAAYLACGPSAVISHRSAAGVWTLLPPDPPGAPVEVSVADGQPRRPGIRVHRIGSFERHEITVVDGIPITTPARTLLDLAVAASARTIERALGEGLALRRVTLRQVRETIERHRRLPGSRRLEAVLDRGQPDLTQSEAEERFLALVRQGDLGSPETNVRIGSYEVDFLWRAEHLVVEVDGWTFHASRRAFERDRRRDGDLAGSGFRVVRVTWDALVNEPMRVVGQVARALEAGRRRAG